MIAKYNEIGCIDTQILPEPKYTDEPGVVDIVYRIEEGEPYTFGELKILGNERTKDKVLRRESVMAGLLPGEPLDANRIEIAKKRLGNLGYFLHAPDQGKPIDIRVTNRRPYDKPYGDLPTATSDLNGVSLTRMQGPDPGPDPAVEVPRVAQAAPMPAPAAAPPGGIVSPFAGSGNDLFTPPPDTPPITVPIPEAISARRRHRAPTPRARHASHRGGRAARHDPEHPRPEHDRRRPRPPGPVPQPPRLRRHHHLGRGGADRPVHARRRGQRLPGA